MKLFLLKRLKTVKIARLFLYKLDQVKNIRGNALSKLVNAIQEVDLVLDVGANVGQFAIDLRMAGYRGEIYSFEPSPSAYIQLLQESSRDPLWSVFNIGFGNRFEFGQLNISSNNGLSSSLLMPKLHVDFFPHIQFVKTEQVVITTISNFFSDNRILGRKILLKIDAQGYESKILEGAEEVFPDISYTFVELSILELYQGEPDALSVLNHLAKLGHRIVDFRRGVESSDGKLLQFDVLTSSLPL